MIHYIWLIGAVLTYIISKIIDRNANNSWENVIIRLLFSICWYFSWIVVGITLLVKYIVEREFPKPPKWL